MLSAAAKMNHLFVRRAMLSSGRLTGFGNLNSSQIAIRSFSAAKKNMTSSDTPRPAATITATADDSHLGSIRSFGSDNRGTITKTLRVLDMDGVKQKQSELHAVDANSDEHIDADELKNLLRKHKGVFTEEEIVEIGELFYAGKSGGSVPIHRFIEAIDRVADREKYNKDKDKDGNVLDMGTCGNEFLFYKSHGNYTKEELDIDITHHKPEGFRDKLAFNSVKGVRFLFDTVTNWRHDNISIDNIMRRVIFLETIAAVPGMVAAIVRHFSSLRNMKRDGGMMQLFLDEANNERMHLLTFVRMKDPGLLFRAAVIAAQFGFGSAFLVAYSISPSFCHRFVGYIEEEACSTYTKIIKTIEEAPEGEELARWKTQRAPSIARAYWKLGETGTVLDLMYAVRADEAEHRDVNHLCTTLDEGEVNPFGTEVRLNTMLLKYVKDVMNDTEEIAKLAMAEKGK